MAFFNSPAPFAMTRRRLSRRAIADVSTRWH